MYTWELVPSNTQTFKSGDMVKLNPEWGAYAYLKREFGEMFPRAVGHVRNGCVGVKVDKLDIEFASQCLTKANA